MAKSTRGFCKYCGKEYTRTGIAKHLQTCKKRVDLCEKAKKQKNILNCCYMEHIIKTIG